METSLKAALNLGKLWPQDRNGQESFLCVRGNFPVRSRPEENPEWKPAFTIYNGDGG